jgi:hypothetical protein
MDTDTRQQIAHRIHLLLRRELGQGIEEARMLADPLYARDVLLVCDAMPASGLAALAQQFRAIEPPAGTVRAAEAAAPLRWPHEPSGFSASRPTGQYSVAALPHGRKPAAARRWLSPTRWLGRA